MNTSESAAKVLIVDDEPNIVIALEFLLQREGYQVEKAYNGLQALELAAAFSPDIVVLDVMMPGMDGFEVARRMRQIDRLEMTKIVFLTAKGTQRDKETGYASGGEYYLIKPFDNEVFVHTINEIMAYG
ncbi:MAG TPA: response regulator [Saprospiraceae bacterium]|nr:response regulator [Saprospiraceae bacterium]HNM24883.1 response regulator [Saprospiraceae bacterium]